MPCASFFVVKIEFFSSKRYDNEKGVKHMSITFFDFQVLPAIIFILSLFMIVFLCTIRIKTGKKKRFFVVSTLTGFIGFCLFFALPFYKPFYEAYFLVPVGFCLLALWGIMGCLSLNINPLDVNTPLFYKEKLTKKNNESNEESPFEQEIKDANKLIDLLLFKLGSSYSYFKNIPLENENELVEFPFIVIGPNGVFPLYPCNWSGEISFSNTNATKNLSTPSDERDYSSSINFREQVIKMNLSSALLNNVPVKSIICVTNPSASITGNPTAYDVVDLGDLSRHLKTISSESLSPELISKIKRTLKKDLD